MMLKLICQIILVLPICILAQESECNLNNFKTSDIVPNIIPKVPEKPMTIEYKDHPVTCGNQLDLNTTHDPPTVVDYEADKTKYYTLIMFDPDVPYPQNRSLQSFRHWLIENIEGNLVNNGDLVSSYYRPTPPSDSDSHRYIFLIYEQPDSMKLNDHFDNNERTNFDVPKFVQERNLTGPVAGNFFLLHP